MFGRCSEGVCAADFFFFVVFFSAVPQIAVKLIVKGN